ncbi:MAG: DUF1292 domain-containing protein [Anaeromicrobium sp.]|uniref:DUF1292 domain-containing protein n=1 Tax=Anaeromicrobium sp. TaxID=1929132 RepID=UPI0025D38C63|nr:DUF1292 domain-containing protein [Anaeromicrobium sp.]MCT4595994.1 DUF1292 domain-containing protein [Anaeromicrobium sp.]
MEEKNIITFMGEDGKAVELQLVERLKIEEDEYVLFAPIGEEDDAYVYKVSMVDGKETYEGVEDDDEFERVLEEYESLF